MTGVGVGLVGAAWAGMSGESCATGSLTGAGGGARLAAGYVSGSGVVRAAAPWLPCGTRAPSRRTGRRVAAEAAGLDHYDGGRTHGWHWKRNS